MTGMTGKDMFEFGGELYADADGAEDDWDISRMLAQYVSVNTAAAARSAFGIAMSGLKEELGQRQARASLAADLGKTSRKNCNEEKGR